MNPKTNVSSPAEKCDCCGWDDSCFQHEPQCSSLSESSPAGWEVRFKEYFEANVLDGDDVKGEASMVAPFFAYEAAREFFKDYLSQRDAELVERVSKLFKPEKGHWEVKDENEITLLAQTNGFNTGVNEALQIIKGTRKV
jgi:hypothetical protein